MINVYLGADHLIPGGGAMVFCEKKDCLANFGKLIVCSATCGKKIVCS